MTNCKDINFAALWYASHFYGDNSEYNQQTGWWEFNAGCIAVQMYSVMEISEFEYNLMKRIFDGQKKPKDYFEIVRSGMYANMDREEIQVHCGENGNLFIFKTDEGFVVDIYNQNQNDNVNSMTVWEEDLEPKEIEVPIGLLDAKGNKIMEGSIIHPTDEEILAFKKQWEQSHSEITANLGYPRSHSDSDELLMVDYFWIEKDKRWYPKSSSLYTPREQLIADYIRYK